MRHQRRQPIVIAKPHFRMRHRVILVHDGNYTQVQQPINCALRIPCPMPHPRIRSREQHLPHMLTIAAETSGPRLHEMLLPHRRNRLLGS